MMRLLGGREIHPVNVRVGGFYRVPTPRGVRAARRASETGARGRARDRCAGWRGFAFPDFERDYEFVALRHPDEYPMNEGRIVSSRGLDIAVADYDSEFEERHVAHSTALQSVLKRRGSYLVGPLARYSLNFDRLPADVQALAAEAGSGPPAATRSAASSCARSRSYTPATKRCV